MVLTGQQLSNGKDHFSLTDRNDQISQRGPVGPNLNSGLFHLISNHELLNFGLNGKP